LVGLRDMGVCAPRYDSKITCTAIGGRFLRVDDARCEQRVCRKANSQNVDRDAVRAMSVVHAAFFQLNRRLTKSWKATCGRMPRNVPVAALWTMPAASRPIPRRRSATAYTAATRRNNHARGAW